MADTQEDWMPRVYTARFFNWLESRGTAVIPVFCFLLGALLSRAFAPTNFFPVLFVAFPLFILLLGRAKSGGEAFGRGWWSGFGFLLFGIYWMGHSFTQQDNVPVFLAPVALFALTAIMSLYYGLVFWVTWRLKARGFTQVLVFASCWTLFEVARGTWFTGFPWHLVGSAWAEWNYIAQNVHWLSVYGLSFVTVLGCGMFALLLQERSWFRASAASALGVLTFVTLFWAGYDRVAGKETEFHLGINLKLVQANVPQREKWLSHLVDDHFDNHLRLSRGSAGKAEGTKLLIWPETAVQSQTFDRKDSLHRWRMSRVLDYNSYAITGAPRYSVSGQEVDYFNSVFAIGSKGDLFARYDKNHLVPFGEYLPFENLLNAIGLQQLAGGVSFTAGTSRQMIRLPGVPGFSPLICYETIFPGRVLTSDGRPEWLLNLSNDAWFGNTEGPYQHLALARLRAIEEGLPMVRSTSTGVSAVIDGYGRTVVFIGQGRRDTLESPLPKALEAPAVPTGAKIMAFVFLSAGVILFMLMRLIRLERTLVSQE